jgi:predicted TPR repeat methyltransferase
MNFDEKAKTWDNDPGRIERARIFAEGIIKLTGGQKFSSALEFGSGTGLVSFQLRDRFDKIILADTSLGMINVLEEKIKRENIVNFSPVKINDSDDLLKINGLDVVYTLLTLHHVSDIDGTFGVFASILKKGGYLFIGDLVTEDGSFHFKDPEFDGHKGFDTSDLKAKLKNEGFECIEDRIILTIEREHNSIIKKYPLFILALQKK